MHQVNSWAVVVEQRQTNSLSIGLWRSNKSPVLSGRKHVCHVHDNAGKRFRKKGREQAIANVLTTSNQLVNPTKSVLLRSHLSSHTCQTIPHPSQHNIASMTTDDSSALRVEKMNQVTARLTRVNIAVKEQNTILLTLVQRLKAQTVQHFLPDLLCLTGHESHKAYKRG